MCIRDSLGVMPTYTFGIYNIFAYNVASEESVPLWSLSDEWRLAPSVALLCLSITVGTMKSRKRASMVQKLYDLGATVEIRDSNKRTLMGIAFDQNDVRMVETLIGFNDKFIN